MSANMTFYPLNTPLINYFFYKAPLVSGGPNIPLAGGKIFTFEDENHAVQAPTYSDVSDPINPVVNTNPIILGAAGDWPPIYFQDRLYFIVITDLNGDLMNPIATISHYNPSQISDLNNSGNINLIANGQFTYPIGFWETTQIPGQVNQPVTNIAWGWQFLQDSNTSTNNNITFNPIYTQNLSGDPTYECQLTSQEVMVGETLKDYVSVLGAVNFLAGTYITISLEAISRSGNGNINVLIEKNYGNGGSDPQILDVTNFMLTSTYAQYTISYLLPANIGKDIQPDNFISIHLQVSLGQNCQVAITNVLSLPGKIQTPIYEARPLSEGVAAILGDATDISQAGFPQNWSSYYYNNGRIFPYSDTGTAFICPKGSIQPFRLEALGQTLNAAEYTNNIPNQRIYSVIGTRYGTSGDLIVTSPADTNTIVFTPPTAGRENSAYTIGDTTVFTVTQLIRGYNLGWSAVANDTGYVTVTGVGNWAADQSVGGGGYLNPPPDSLIGNWYLNSVTNAPMNVPLFDISITQNGSVSTPPIAVITFETPLFSCNVATQSGYTAGSPNGHAVYFLEFATLDNNIRGAWPNGFSSCITFSSDGFIANPAGDGNFVQGTQNATVNYLSSEGYATAANLLADAFNNPFVWQFTITGLPSLVSGVCQYILYSSINTDYYAYFTIDGMGTDPMVSMRTGQAVPLLSSMTIQQMAATIAATLSSFNFNLPVQADYPTIPSDTKSNWYINL